MPVGSGYPSRAASDPGTHGPRPDDGTAGYCLLELGGEPDELDGIEELVLGGARLLLDPQQAERPLVYDGEDVSLQDGESAWVPALVTGGGSGPWQVASNLLARVHVVPGEIEGSRPDASRHERLAAG
eukprot:12892320-Alexandrium_andersonii.AAC.1